MKHECMCEQSRWERRRAECRDVLVSSPYHLVRVRGTPTPSAVPEITRETQSHHHRRDIVLRRSCRMSCLSGAIQTLDLDPHADTHSGSSTPDIHTSKTAAGVSPPPGSPPGGGVESPVDGEESHALNKL